MKTILERPGLAPDTVISAHLAQLRQRIGVLEDACKRLDTLQGIVRSRQAVTMEALLQTIEVIRMSEKTPFNGEQMETIRQQGRMLGQEGIESVQRERPDLMTMFTGGNQGVADTLAKRYQDPTYSAQFGLASSSTCARRSRPSVGGGAQGPHCKLYQPDELQKEQKQQQDADREDAGNGEIGAEGKPEQHPGPELRA